MSLVIDGIHARHRLQLLADVGEAGRPRFVLRTDLSVNERLAALASFLRQTASSRPFRPTPYRRERFVRLLAILDLIDQSTGTPATVRQVARDITFRGLPPLRAAEWKASSQRRQTQRLMAEAAEIRDHGYLKLLLGEARTQEGSPAGAP